MTHWPTLRLTCTPAELSVVEEWLLSAAADLPDAEALRGARLEDSRGEGGVSLVVTFADGASRDLLARWIQSAGPRVPVTAESLAEEDSDWVAAVAGTELPIPLGRRFAALPGAARPLAGRTGIRLPRARAFGTGEHPTTRLAAEMLEEFVEAGAPLLDLGAGTAVLAVLGYHLGARPVLAVERDPVACTVARRTLAGNDATEILLVAGSLAGLRPDHRFRTMVANIERDTLVSLMPEFMSRLEPGGLLILSGLLREQLDTVVREAVLWGGVELERRHADEWGALLITRRPARLPQVLVPHACPDGRGWLSLPSQEAHHLVRSRRQGETAAVEVTDGQGGAWIGRLAEGTEGWGISHCLPVATATETSFPLTLMPAVLHESRRMEAMLRQAVELGTAAIRPVIMARCQGGRQGWAPMDRWRRVVAEAVKQCGRTTLPELHDPVSLREIARAGPEAAFFLDPSGASLGKLLSDGRQQAASLLVGPEGGISAPERRLLLDGGWRAARVGPRILRAGTAAAAASTLIVAAWGDLGEIGLS
ncbi:MAG: RsmE family RNA methyltransferase [Acidobacteria bacterium]|nr:RsmE family RNA methyltransferase [Acidobacteriota bacterium]